MHDQKRGDRPYEKNGGMWAHNSANVENGHYFLFLRTSLSPRTSFASHFSNAFTAIILAHAKHISVISGLLTYPESFFLLGILLRGLKRVPKTLKVRLNEPQIPRENGPPKDTKAFSRRQKLKVNKGGIFAKEMCELTQRDLTPLRVSD